MAEEARNVQGTAATAAEPDERVPAERTFTQAEVDEIVTRRLAREAKKYPSEGDMAAYRQWKAAHETDDDKIGVLTRERDEARRALDEAKAQIEANDREKYLLGQGVPAEDVDYYAYKIGKLVTDTVPFAEAAKTYLKDHAPAVTGKNTVRVDTAGSVSGGDRAAMTTNEKMNALIRGARR